MLVERVGKWGENKRMYRKHSIRNSELNICSDPAIPAVVEKLKQLISMSLNYNFIEINLSISGQQTIVVQSRSICRFDVK